MLSVTKNIQMIEKDRTSITVPGTFTLLTYELLSMVDKGRSIPMSQFMTMCENYSIMSWLKENSRYYDVWDDNAKIIIAEEFCSLANCVIPEDTYGIANNGILALAAFCQELINQKGPSREKKHCDCAEDRLRKMGLI